MEQCPGADAFLGTTPVAGRNDKLHPKVEVQLSWSALEYCSPDRCMLHVSFEGDQ